MRAIARCLTSVALAGALASCHDLTSSLGTTAPPIVVHAVLDLGFNDQVVLVTRARTGGDSVGTPGNLGSGVPVTGATITITGPDGVKMTATPDRFRDGTVVPGQYRISLIQFGEVLLPGATYTLRIVPPDGDVVTGTTTVPEVAPVTSVITLNPFSVDRDTVRLAWQPITGARGYEAHVETPRAVYSTFTDTAFMMPGTARTIDDDPLFVPGSQALVVVSAVDRNYYEYYRTPSDPFAGTPPGHLTGAVGVFGSVVPIIRMLYAVH